MGEQGKEIAQNQNEILPYLLLLTFLFMSKVAEGFNCNILLLIGIIKPRL